MKRFVLSAVAVSMLAVPTIQSAQAAPNNAPQGQYTQQDWKKKPGRHDSRRDWNRPGKPSANKNHWRHGQKYSSWKRHQPIRDYGRYGLRRPGPGQEWIRVGNDYVLVGILSGIVFGAIAAR